VDYFERHGTPFIVAVNCFEGALKYQPEDVRVALDLDSDVPVLMCDARIRESGKEVLIALIEHAMKTARKQRAANEPAPTR
jgi:signal recognition particle receptor subunit beta